MVEIIVKSKNKNILFFVIILFVFTGGILAAQQIGDVNNDGTLNIVDALLVAQYYVGLNPSGFDQSLADLNSDGQIDIVDALVIAQIYVGLQTPVPTPTDEPTPTPYSGSGGFGLGADVSEGKYASEQGVNYKDRNGSSGHYLDILRNHGFDWIWFAGDNCIDD